MKFNEDTDLSEIIGNYTKNNDYYKIEYLDGNISEYYNSDNKHEEIINLENKFKLLEIFLFIIGIFLGIVAKNFEFGFVLCFLFSASE